MIRVWFCQSVGTPISVRVTEDQLVEDAIKAALVEMKTDISHHKVLVKFGYEAVKKDVSVTYLVILSGSSEVWIQQSNEDGCLSN